MLYTDPFSLLADLERQFDTMTTGRAQARAGWLPAADVVADEHEVRVYMDAPGMRHEDLAIELHDGVLTISGERRPLDVSKTAVQRVERGWGHWTRTMRLPNGLDADAVSADLTDGVLTVRIPIAEAAKPRRIAIGTSGRDTIDAGAGEDRPAERELADTAS